MHALDAPVAALMRAVAAEIMLPRFRALADHEVREKAPGDIVTVVDQLSEARLTEGLAALLPGSRVVGEEACAAAPALIETIADGRVWIVDPLDGTANFAAGEGPFGIMVALVEDGAIEAGWILDPISGRMCSATRGRGAYVDGARVRARATGAEPPLAALATRFLPDERKPGVATAAAGRFVEVPVPGCAAEQYPRVALGANDVALFWRTLAWDHAPGALFLNEAGGRVARYDGADYRPGDGRTGLIAAATPELWERAAAILVPALKSRADAL